MNMHSEIALSVQSASETLGALVDAISNAPMIYRQSALQTLAQRIKLTIDSDLHWLVKHNQMGVAIDAIQADIDHASKGTTTEYTAARDAAYRWLSNFASHAGKKNKSGEPVYPMIAKQASTHRIAWRGGRPGQPVPAVGKVSIAWHKRDKPAEAPAGAGRPPKLDYSALHAAAANGAGATITTQADIDSLAKLVAAAMAAYAAADRKPASRKSVRKAA